VDERLSTLELDNLALQTIETRLRDLDLVQLGVTLRLDDMQRLLDFLHANRSISDGDYGASASNITNRIDTQTRSLGSEIWRTILHSQSMASSSAISKRMGAVAGDCTGMGSIKTPDTEECRLRPEGVSPELNGQGPSWLWLAALVTVGFVAAVLNMYMGMHEQRMLVKTLLRE